MRIGGNGTVQVSTQLSTQVPAQLPAQLPYFSLFTQRPE